MIEVSDVLRVEKNGNPIVTVDDWFRLAPPKKGKAQWRDGRSAKEMAKRWIGGLPEEVELTLRSHADLRPFQAELAEPEVQTHFDEFGRPREHDLVVVGKTDGVKALMAIEGKTDETFDRPISERLSNAGTGSNLPERIRRLSTALFGDPDPEFLGGLRYQLVYATAATVVEADVRGCSIAVFLVHVLHTDLTTEALMAQNSADLDSFVSALTRGRKTGLGPQELIGPIGIPGHGTIPAFDRLYIGKAVADLRT